MQNLQRAARAMPPSRHISPPPKDWQPRLAAQSAIFSKGLELWANDSRHVPQVQGAAGRVPITWDPGPPEAGGWHGQAPELKQDSHETEAAGAPPQVRARQVVWRVLQVQGPPVAEPAEEAAAQVRARARVLQVQQVQGVPERGGYRRRRDLRAQSREGRVRRVRGARACAAAG